MVTYNESEEGWKSRDADDAVNDGLEVDDVVVLFGVKDVLEVVVKELFEVLNGDEVPGEEVPDEDMLVDEVLDDEVLTEELVVLVLTDVPVFGGAWDPTTAPVEAGLWELEEGACTAAFPLQKSRNCAN